MSSDEWNRHAGTVTVLPPTRTRHGFPTRVEIEPDDDNGLVATSYARCEDVRAISKRRRVRRVGVVGSVVTAQVAVTLRRFLEI